MTSKSPAASSSGKPLEDRTVVELKDLCKERGIKGFAHKSKAKLLEMIEAAPKTSAKTSRRKAAGTSAKTPAKAGADTSGTSRPGKSGKSGLKKKPKATTQDKDQQGDLASRTIVQLRQLCKEQGIKGFARKNKQQLLEILHPTAPSGSSNRRTEIDVEEKKNPDPPTMKNSPADGADADLLYSEDLDANQVDQEESADGLASAELDAVTEDFDSQFSGDAEETMVEVSDHLILEVLERFDRIEALLQGIAEVLATNAGNP